jgi:hypothetical protein
MVTGYAVGRLPVIALADFLVTKRVIGGEMRFSM